MIGDNPLSDIQGANAREGWTSILVKTGVFNQETEGDDTGNSKIHPADHVVEDLAEAVQLIMKLEDLEPLIYE